MNTHSKIYYIACGNGGVGFSFHEAVEDFEKSNKLLTGSFNVASRVLPFPTGDRQLIKNVRDVLAGCILLNPDEMKILVNETIHSFYMGSNAV